MAQQQSRSALERLEDHYNATQLVCPACGYEEESGTWVGKTNGASARYSRECSSCGATQEYTLTFPE
jgi:transcription elongation factor Elf1